MQGAIDITIDDTYGMFYMYMSHVAVGWEMIQSFREDFGLKELHVYRKVTE